MYGFQPKSQRGKAMPKLADGGVVPFGSRGVAAVRDLIPKMQAMGFQPAPPPAAPADTSNTARLRAMIPQMEAMGYKQQPQYLADGGMVDTIKGMMGLRPKTREELLAADAKAQARNQEAAAKMAARAAATQAPAPAPQSAITDYAGMTAMQRREKEQGLKNGGMVKPHGFKAGGLIVGPGTGTSDSIETEKKPGTFIMPADSTQAFGPEALEELGEGETTGEEMRDPMAMTGDNDESEGEGEGAEGDTVPVRVSNGEFEFPPEQVQALGEAVLTVMRDATHEPVGKSKGDMPRAAGFAPGQFFADGGLIENDVTRVGNSYSGGNVGGNITVNGQEPGGSVSTASPVPSNPVPATTSATPATALSAATAPPPAALATATPAPSAAPMDWAARNAQRSNQVTASSIMDSPERRAAQAALAPTPAPAPAPTLATTMDVTKQKPVGVQPPAFGTVQTPAGFQPRRYANGGTVQDEEKQRLANQTAMYVQGAQAQAASRPQAPTAAPQPAATPAAPTAAGFMPSTRAVFNESGKAIGDLAKQGRYAAAAGETARAALAYGPAVVDDVVGGALRAVVPPVVDAGKQFFGSGESAPAPASTPTTKTASAAVTPAPQSTAPLQKVATAPAADPTQSNTAQQPAATTAPADSGRTAAGFAPRSAPATMPQVVRNSTNDWAARKALENAATAASSITANGGRFDQNGPAGSPQAAAYRAALATDQALQQAQPGMDQAAMREGGANQRATLQDAGATERTVIQDQGANTREAGRTALAGEEMALKRTAAGFQTRAAAQLENLQNAYAAEKDPAKQAALARQIREIQGKEQPARFKVAAGGQQVDASGVTYKVPDRIYNEQTGQIVDGGGAAAQPTRPVGTTSTVNGKTAVWDGAKWVPR
jgi:hypothetical protein